MGYLSMVGDSHFHRGYSLRLQKSKPLISYGIISFTWRGRRTQLRRIPPHVVPLALLPIYHSILPGILRANQAKLPVNLLHSLMSTTLVHARLSSNVM